LRRSQTQLSSANRFFLTPGTGLDLPADDADERTLQEVTLEAIDLPPGAKAVLALQLPPGSVTLFDPVTHVAQLMTVEGEPTRERQSLSVVLSTQEDRAVRPGVAPSGRVNLRPRWMWPATRSLPGK
jgi:Family of unknown function (DUF5939)